MSIRDDREKRKKKDDYVDGDRLSCAGCDRFVNSIDGDGLCDECKEMLE